MHSDLLFRGPLRIGVALFFTGVTCALAAQAAPPPVTAIEFAGEMPFAAKRALEVTGLRPGTPYDPAAAQSGAEALRQACARRYHPMARVEWRAIPEEQTESVRLLYTLEQGPRGKLQEVRFTGNAAIPDHELHAVLTVTPHTGFAARLIGRDMFIPADLSASREALRRRYHQSGRIDAEIGPAVVAYDDQLAGFRVTWPVLQEGPLYTIGTIRLSGDPLPDQATLTRLLAIRSGDPFDPGAVEKVRAALEAYYYRKGHAFAQVTTESSVDDAQQQVDVRYDIEPGTMPRLNRLRIRGNRVSHDRIIEREIQLDAGAPFNASELEDTHLRLSLLPLFEAVELTLHGDAVSDTFDLQVDVAERKTGRIEAGFLYGEVEGGAFQVNLIENNLAFRPPFRGQALQARLGATVGSRILRLDASLRNPRIGHSLWSAIGAVAVEDNRFISADYDQRSQSGQLLAGHPVGWYQLVHSGYAVTRFDVYNVSPDVEPLLTDLETDAFLTSWILMWNLDRTDQLLRPTKGIRARTTLGLGSRWLGGDTDVVQVSGNGALFFNPVGEHVIALRAGLKSVDPYGDTANVPLPLRLYLGGVSDLRGFRYRSVSPRDDEGRLAGGETAWWGTAEYLLPLHRRMDLALYMDAGDVAENAFEWAGDGPVTNWGVGLLLRADNFPVRLDVAAPIKTLADDAENKPGEPRVSVSVGYVY